MNCEGKYQGATTFKDGLGNCYKIEYDMCNNPVGKVSVVCPSNTVKVDTSLNAITINAKSRGQEDMRTLAQPTPYGQYIVAVYGYDGKVIDYYVSATPTVTIGLDKNMTREISIQSTATGLKTYYTF